MSFVDSLVSGGIAGTCVDLVFFPIDTLKTRLQAKNGFFANGGWRGVYSGVGSTIVASAPGAALFFVVYDQLKQKLKQNTSLSDPKIHMISSSLGEVAACTVRVPSEVIKQRVQTGVHARSMHALKAILSNTLGEGVFKGLYRGFSITLMREIPFTAVQFPLYEKLKKTVGANERPYLSAGCGMVAGGFAAAITTPLDVIKTRVMLQKHHNAHPDPTPKTTSTTGGTSKPPTDTPNGTSNGTTNETVNTKSTPKRVSLIHIVRDVASEGPSAFWRGVVPRTMWISMGGAVFLGVYEISKDAITRSKLDKSELV